ncbi:MAG: hypothetical protein ACFFC3_04230 [Candidatus Odinarchaeota archaeon]
MNERNLILKINQIKRSMEEIKIETDGRLTNDNGCIVDVDNNTSLSFKIRKIDGELIIGLQLFYKIK